jgi:hypothetical protein
MLKVFFVDFDELRVIEPVVLDGWGTATHLLDVSINCAEVQVGGVHVLFELLNVWSPEQTAFTSHLPVVELYHCAAVHVGGVHVLFELLNVWSPIHVAFASHTPVVVLSHRPAAVQLALVARQELDALSNGDVTGQFAAVALHVPDPASHGCASGQASQVLVEEFQAVPEEAHVDSRLTSQATVELLNHCEAVHATHEFEPLSQPWLAALHVSFWLVSQAPVSGFGHCPAGHLFGS